ncbi:MAG: hypothetical protein BGO40_09105 [Chryseobacterium sp. 39-10]|nr:hypothetical protein [Chryseobacterium sp.]OJV46141.1 MAG: hypothetical protein BGO40_09105 [Chryseobacterium sp. 39-10]
MTVKQKATDFLKTVFPATPFELLLFVIFLSAYGTLGTYIALHYRIVFDDRIPWDAYFSFDNRAIVMTGGGFERHPLANYFFDWIRELALVFSDGKKNDIFRLVLAWCSNIAVSLSLIQIYKYLKNIIRLPKYISLLILTFFALFATTILLSFTPETYTYTLFFLVLFNYYAALKLRKEEKIPAAALTLATISVGGLTVTNAVKVFIPLFFEKGIYKSWKKWGNAVLRIIISVGVFVLLFLYRLDFNYMQFLNKSGEQYEKFSKPKVTPLWDMIYSWFFGGNMLFSSFIIRDYHSKEGFQYKALSMDVYTSLIPYLFVAVVLILVLWSYFKNFKNKLVQVLMISFLVDIIIHCILKFGLHTSYIYGGHFIFVIPLMLGWLFYGYRDSPRIMAALLCTVSLLLFYLGMNNLWRMEEFFVFLDKYYQ